MAHTHNNSRGAAVVGIVLISAGLLLMMQKFQMIDVGSVWSQWPLIFVIIGAVKLSQMENKKDLGEGIWWIFIGTWLYVSIRHLFGLSFSETWPALIIAWGVSMIWKSFNPHTHRLVKE